MKRALGTTMAAAFAVAAIGGSVLAGGPPPNSGPPIPETDDSGDKKTYICHYPGHSHLALDKKGGDIALIEYDFKFGGFGNEDNYCTAPFKGTADEGRVQPGIVILVSDKALDAHNVGKKPEPIPE